MRLARQRGGAIINADALQVYRELRLLSARPSAEDEAAVPHRLYGYALGEESYSVARWLADARTEIAAPCVPLYANVTAAPVADADIIRVQLVEQVTGMVRWRESVANLAAAGVEEFVELGGKVLGPMVKRIAPDAKVTSILTIEDIEALAKEIA